MVLHRIKIISVLSTQQAIPELYFYLQPWKLVFTHLYIYDIVSQVPWILVFTSLSKFTASLSKLILNAKNDIKYTKAFNMVNWHHSLYWFLNLFLRAPTSSHFILIRPKLKWLQLMCWWHWHAQSSTDCTGTTPSIPTSTRCTNDLLYSTGIFWNRVVG